MTRNARLGSPELFRSPLWLKASAAILLFAVAITFGFYIVFSRKLSLDEGYLMITVRGFLEGNALYDKLFTQYGPFYYLYEWFLHGVLRVPLTEDATRWLCLFHWTAASVLLAVAAARISQSLVVGAFVFAQAIIHVGGLSNEPGHPQELGVLLLTLGVACATRQDGRIRNWDLLAVIAAALVFTKINVGAFFGFALFLTLRCFAVDRFSRWTNWLLAVFCAAAPFALMRHRLADDGCRSVATVASFTLLATFIVARCYTSKFQISGSRYVRLAAFFIVPAVVFAGVALVTGSSMHGLLDGLILTPMGMPKTVFLTLPLRSLVLLNAVVALGTGFFFAWQRTNKHARVAASILKLCYGMTGAFVLIGGAVAQFAYLLPWVWLVLVPSRVDEETAGAASFPRVFLCLAGAWQSLQVYPIAGTQVTNATSLLVITYALCLVDALRAVPLAERWKEQLARLTPSTARLAQVFGVAVLLYVFANVWCDLPAVRRYYASLPTLDLPGSRLVRVIPESKAFFHELVDYLEAESDTFFTLPQINSLYFWTSKRPPTQLNGTGWYQFDHRQQNQILTAVRSGSRPRILLPADFREHLSRYWYTPEQIAPLLDCLANECREVHRIGPMAVYEPNPLPQVSKAP